MWILELTGAFSRVDSLSDEEFDFVLDEIIVGGATRPEALHTLDEKKMTQATFSDKVEGDGSKFQLKGTGYSPEYVEMIENTYSLFYSKGYHIGEHGINRILGRIKQGRISSVEEIFDVLATGKKYSDTINGGIVIFKNGISIHVSDDGFIKTVIGEAKIKPTWEEFR